MLEGGDNLPDRVVFRGVVALLPSEGEISSPGSERRQHERGGKEDGLDPHGTAP
jgi:hypothetical protein